MKARPSARKTCSPKCDSTKDQCDSDFRTRTPSTLRDRHVAPTSTSFPFYQSRLIANDSVCAPLMYDARAKHASKGTCEIIATIRVSKARAAIMFWLCSLSLSPNNIIPLARGGQLVRPFRPQKVRPRRAPRRSWRRLYPVCPCRSLEESTCRRYSLLSLARRSSAARCDVLSALLHRIIDTHILLCQKTLM